MAKTALLHIGTNKTGSTSIQEALFRGQELGTISPVRYPMHAGEKHSHTLMAMLYLPYERFPPGLRSGFHVSDAGVELRRQYRSKFFRELHSPGNVILSSENFALFSSSEVARLRKDLEAAGFIKFTIVLYVRDPANYYLSRIQENLKMSNQVWDPISFHYRFREIAETWEGTFPDELIVRHYRDDPEYDVVRDFSALLLENLGVELPRIRARANRTISAEGMEILQRYRSAFWSDANDVFTPDTTSLVDFLKKPANESVRQTVPVLKPDVSARIRANHMADAEFLRDRYGVDLKLHGVDENVLSHFSRSPRVDEILQDLDSEVVTQLLLRLAKSGLDRAPEERTIANRVVARISRGLSMRSRLIGARSRRPR